MPYIKVEIDDIGEAYQETLDGNVLAYRALDGTLLFDSVPDGRGSRVTDESPKVEAWMTVLGNTPGAMPKALVDRALEVATEGELDVALRAKRDRG